MNLWMILKNLGTIKALIESIGALIGIISKKEKPNKEQIRLMLDQVEALLRSGAVDVPNVDENQVADILQTIEDQLLK